VENDYCPFFTEFNISFFLVLSTPFSPAACFLAMAPAFFTVTTNDAKVPFMLILLFIFTISPPRYKNLQSGIQYFLIKDLHEYHAGAGS